MRQNRKIFLLLLFLVISDSITYINDFGAKLDSFTIVSTVIKYCSLWILFFIARRTNWSVNIPAVTLALLKTFLIWNIVTIIRGMAFASDYWDWKFLLLNSGLFFLIPLAFFIGSNLKLARLLFKYVLKYLFPFGFLLIPLALATNHQLYSRLMIPISVFIVFIPYLQPKWRGLTFIVTAVSILMVIDFRTNIIKAAISLLICLLYYIRKYIRMSVIKILHPVIFALPLILLVLAVTGSFNVFKSTADPKNTSLVVKSEKQGYGDEENLTADTRTFLYVDVLTSLTTNGTLTIGEGGSGKYKTDSFDYLGDHRGRYSSEVGFLNILLYSGVIGAILYFLILFISSYYAIYKSNNFLCKMLGLLIAARWLLFFIEEFTSFDLNTLFTWVIIGLVSNTTFRALTDNELKLYFNI